MLEQRRKENDEKQKARLWKSEVQKERQRTQTNKKMGNKSENGPIIVATTSDAWANSPLLPDLQ
jgi:hypothetical protein